MKNIRIFISVLFASILLACAQAEEVRISKPDEAGKIRIDIGGKLFTEYIPSGWKKPILYPVIGPHGIGMTRNYPMKKGVDGEREDHPHHTSIFFTHGKVNGQDFWHKGGDILQSKLVKAELEDGVAVIEANHAWKAKGKDICSDTTVIRAGVENGSRFIDYAITIHASQGDILFGDTKEGTMGIRTHHGLRVNKGAKAINSSGDEGKSVWGKSAKWICYYNKVEGHEVGITIMDHPSNPRHPTTWHARDYGLVAANPFGLSYFKGKGNNGNMTVKKGESVTFKYRYLFHAGDHKKVDAEGRFKTWAGK